jgi:hypothetical protein
MFNTAARTGYLMALLALLSLALATGSPPLAVTTAVLLVACALGGLTSVARAMWQRRAATSADEYGIGVVLADRQPTIGGTYASLHAYLEHRFASTVVLTFEQVESLLGFALPQPASTERDWWTSGAPHRDRHSEAWTAAGRSAAPNLLARTVAFERIA